jgi:flagellar hook-basal body complex protein FliE
MTMTIGSIGAIQGAGGVQGPHGSQEIRRQAVRQGDTGWISFDPDPGRGPSFGDALKQALGEASDLQDKSKDAIAAFVRGDPVELHDVMAATEEAGLALEFLIEIRNKITEAYRTVINMQS